MNYTPQHPDWQYSVISIPNSELIQQELLAVFWKLTGTAPEGTAFISLYSHQHVAEWQSLLHLNQWLKTLGLENRDKLCYFSVLNHASINPIHVDYANEERFISINIPLLNCENSFTVWYDADIDHHRKIKETMAPDTVQRLLIYDESAEEYFTGETSYWCHQENAVEINRVECVTPMLVNTSLPHRPVVDHNNLRVLFAMRILPELSKEELSRFQLQTPLFN